MEIASCLNLQGKNGRTISRFHQIRGPAKEPEVSLWICIAAAMEGTMERRITRDDAIRAIGRANDAAIAEMIGTGATVEELAEAQAWLANDEPMLNSGRPLAHGRVRLLVDILSDLQAAEEEEDGPILGGSH
jgi:hypothetical protein